MTQLLRFLTEKGAYWSGVARDANVGGKVSSLYSVLWYDFINNPFFVGTIAKTEDILKIHIRIILYNHPVGEEQISNKTLYHDKKAPGHIRRIQFPYRHKKVVRLTLSPSYY